MYSKVHRYSVYSVVEITLDLCTPWIGTRYSWCTSVVERAIYFCTPRYTETAAVQHYYNIVKGEIS